MSNYSLEDVVSWTIILMMGAIALLSSGVLMVCKFLEGFPTSWWTVASPILILGALFVLGKWGMGAIQEAREHLANDREKKKVIEN